MVGDIYTHITHPLMDFSGRYSWNFVLPLVGSVLWNTTRGDIDGIFKATLVGFDNAIGGIRFVEYHWG